MNNLTERINAATAFIRQKTDFTPAMGLVLGSGLGDFATRLTNIAATIPFGDIPGFPAAGVAGHAGQLVLGYFEDNPVAVLNGRAHFYEGISQQEATIPVRVLRRLGAHTLLLTNAAGGVNLSFVPGSLMLICDHINFSGQNPLMGPNLDEFGTRFPDAGDIYTAALRRPLLEAAQQAQLAVCEGVYLMYSGPNYETPAEIRAFRTLGADAVGMSTVPEALVARHAGMRVIGISCITNMAAGVLNTPLSHEEVVSTGARVKEDFARLVAMAIGLGAAAPA